MKQLQKEVARLEAELRTPDASEKDMKIHQVNFVSISFGCSKHNSSVSSLLNSRSLKMVQK